MVFEYFENIFEQKKVKRHNFFLKNPDVDFFFSP